MFSRPNPHLSIKSNPHTLCKTLYGRFFTVLFVIVAFLSMNTDCTRNGLPFSFKQHLLEIVYCTVYFICFLLQSVVRTSDVRVSNRVNKESLTLARYSTVYNDLTGEVQYHL